MFRRSSIQCLAATLLAWTTPLFAHAGFLVPGHEGTWQELTEAAATEIVTRADPARPAGSDADDPADRPKAQFSQPSDGMSSHDLSRQTVTSACWGSVSRLVGGELRLDFTEIANIRRPNPCLAGIFRPPRKA